MVASTSSFSRVTGGPGHLPQTSLPPASGLYVPVHRRGASTGSLPSSSPAHSPSTSPRASSPLSHARPKTGSTVDQSIANIPHASHIPAPTSTNNNNTNNLTYSIPQLLALSRSPLVSITPEARAHIAQVMPDPAQTAAQKAQSRRRRSGRRTSNATRPSLAAVSNTDVESRRRRHAAWGWSAPAQAPALAALAHVAAEDSWRHGHAQAVGVVGA